MPRHKSLIPSEYLRVALPLDVHTRLVAELFSPLEGRVPLGAYSKKLSTLLREDAQGKTLDLAPYRQGVPSGVLFVRGSVEAIDCLTQLLGEKA